MVMKNYTLSDELRQRLINYLDKQILIMDGDEEIGIDEEAEMLAYLLDKELEQIIIEGAE